MPADNDKKPGMASDSKKVIKRKPVKKRGEYKVVFKGLLREGFTKAQVIANIVRLTKIPEEKINQKFFSGKAVIIRRAHDETHAQKLQQLFFNAGLEVVILKDMAQQEQRDKQASKEVTKKDFLKQELKTELKKTVKTRKRPILAMVLWLILIVIAYELWTEFDISVEVPDEIVSIEQSLANESLVFLAHVNVQRLLSLQDYFVDDPNALPGVNSNFYSNLKSAGIDPQTSVQQLLMTGYMDDKELITHTILLGQFSVAAVKGFLLKHYHGKVIADPDFVRMQIAEIDATTCEKGNFKELSIEADRILITSTGHLDELRRLLAKTPGSVTDLSNWEGYRSDKLASIALFKPEQGTQLTSGLTAMMARGVAKKNKALNSLFAGIGMQLLPPAGLLDVSLNSPDQTWLQQTREELEQQIADMKDKSQGLANLLTLLNKISVHQGANQLSVNLQLDSELKKSIANSMQEWSDKFFSIESSSQQDTAAAVITEKIDDQPLQFKPSYNKSGLSAFNKQLDQFFEPAWSSGPFAVAIEELLLENDQVVLQLRGKGQNIDNVGSQQAKLKLLAVHDHKGANLLAQSACGQATIAEESYFSSFGGLRTAFIDNKPVKYNELEVRKKVRLKPGVHFSEVKSLQAKIELDLPTRTRTEQFAKAETEKHKTLMAYGSRLFFKPSASNTLDYTVSGDEQRILMVRALNKDKRYLSRSSSSSMGSLWGSGRSVSQSYHGEVAFVEVVYAEQMEKMSYPVAISKFPPYYSEDEWRYDAEPVKISNLKAWNAQYQDVAALDMTQENNWLGEQQAVWHDGPFNLALYALKSNKHWGTSGQIYIKTPVIDELRHNLSALEFYIRYPQVAENGEVGKSYYYQLKAKGYYMNGEFIADKAKPYMEGQLSFNLPAVASAQQEEETINTINGDIIVHLPLSKHSSSFTDMSIGAQWEDEGVIAKIVRLANNVLEFEVSGSRSRLLQITLFDADEQRISTSDVQQGFGSVANQQKDKIVVNYHGVPVKAQMTVSEGQQTRRYPFQLQLN